MESAQEVRGVGVRGFRDLHLSNMVLSLFFIFIFMNIYNISLLAKQGCRLLTQPYSLWAQLMHSIHYSKAYNASAKLWASWDWKIALLAKGIHQEVGDWFTIDIWKDRQIPTLLNM